MDQSNNDVDATTVDFTGITGRLYRRPVAGGSRRVSIDSTDSAQRRLSSGC